MSRTAVYTNPQPYNQSVNFGVAPFGMLTLDGLDGAPGDLQTQKAPYQDGVTFIDFLYKDRTITVTGIINKPQNLSQVDTQRRALEAVLNPKLGVGTFVFTDANGTQYTIPAIPTSQGLKYKPFTDAYQKYQVIFECPSPYWNAFSPSSFSYLATTPELQFLTSNNYWAFPVGGAAFSQQTSQLSRTAISDGDVPAPLTVTIHGPAVNPTLFNETLGVYFRLFLTLPSSNDYVIWTSGFGIKTVTVFPNSGGSYNGLSLVASGSTFWELVPGDNVLAFTSDDGTQNQTITLSWYDQYLGV